MQADIEEIVQISWRKALDHEAKGNIGEAYAYYTAVLELCPNKRLELEEKFTTILCEWGIQLEKNHRTDDLIKCYENSLELFPRNSAMLNNFASHLLTCDELLRAIKYFKKAIEVDENFLPAHRNLENAYSMAIDRWHYSMLNDKGRNQAYDQAIKKRILAGYDTVLDIGTGTGILSLYALNAGAKEIYACEYATVMCQIAKKVFHKNNADNIKLLHKDSLDLQIPQDIPARIKLIVTEIFDAAIFGEYVVSTLIHAHENLLATDETGIVIPMSATLYVAAVESEYIRFKSSILFDKCEYIKPLNFDNIVILPNEEFYDTDNLENVDVKYITEPNPILKINFNDINDLKHFNTDGIKNILSTTSCCDAKIDGLIVWFKLNLDEEIELDTSKNNSCWQIAVFPHLVHNVKVNDKIVITAEILFGRLKCSYQLKHTDFNLQDKSVYRLQRHVTEFLNDKEYIKSLIKAAQSKRNENIKSVFDMCPFPIYGLTLLKGNRNCEIVYSNTQNPATKHFIEHIIHKNNIVGKVCFVSSGSEIGSTDTVLVNTFDTKGELLDRGQQSFRDIFSYLLSSSGTLLPERIFLMGQFVYSKQLPKMVSVKDENLQMYEYSILSNDKDSHVDCSNDDDDDYNDNDDDDDDDDDDKNNDDYVVKIQNSNLYSKNCKLVVGEFINKFKINQVFDLHPKSYVCETLSEVKTLTEIGATELKEEVINFGKFNKDSKTIPNALICWFKIFLSDDNIIETRRSNSFINHMAVVFEDELQDKVLQGENIYIKIQQMRDIVKIKLV